MTKQEVIELLRCDYQELGRLPTIPQFLCKHGWHSNKNIYNYFKSYKDLCIAATGIASRYFSRKPSPRDDQEILDDIGKVAVDIGHIPTYIEYVKTGKFSVITIRNAFGSFHKARLQLGFAPEKDTWDIEKVSNQDGHWLSGFVEGEGCFRVQRPRKGMPRSFELRFSITQRLDRYSAIHETARILGLEDEVIEISQSTMYTPCSALLVTQIPIIARRIVPFFDRFKLRGKKYEDFCIFKSATLLLWHKYITGGKRHLSRQEFFALNRLSQYSSLVKEPNVTLRNIKTHLLSNHQDE